MADEIEFKDVDVRKAAEQIKMLRGKRESLVMSIAEIDKVIGGAKAFNGFNAESIMATFQKYKPMLVKAGFATGGGGLFSFLPQIKSLLGGLLG